jgi:ATP synthase protein I
MMDEPEVPKKNRHQLQRNFTHKVGAKEKRKLRARREKNRSVWFGLGLLGLIGWSVVVPTLLGVALGIWLDTRMPSRFSWTLTLMFAGLILGCLNAWQWVTREQASIKRTDEEDAQDNKP